MKLERLMLDLEDVHQQLALLEGKKETYLTLKAKLESKIAEMESKKRRFNDEDNADTQLSSAASSAVQDGQA